MQKTAIFFTLRESRVYPISFVAKGSAEFTTASPLDALDLGGILDFCNVRVNSCEEVI